jgi:hypothetical protein
MTPTEISDLVAQLRNQLRLIPFNGVIGEDLNVIKDVISERTAAADLIESLTAPFKLRLMSEAPRGPKDIKIILAKFKTDFFGIASPFFRRGGSWLPVKYHGIISNLWLGWDVACSNAEFGFPEEAFEGWTYLPGEAPAETPNAKTIEQLTAERAAAIRERDELDARIERVIEHINERMEDDCAPVIGNIISYLGAELIPAKREVIEIPARVVRK